jgi:SPP1 gp7 family putative phage head morphogenesis protein
VKDADELIADKQLQWARLGIGHAAEAVQLSYFGAGQVAPYFDRLPIEAIENMIGYAGDGSPLKTLLSGCYPEAAEGLLNQLATSTALGRNPRETAKAMRDGFGVGLNKALKVARTEQMRPYREAGRQQYELSGVVEGFTRLAAHDVRTCLACLAAEGQCFEVVEQLTDHPQGRCSAVPKVMGLPLANYQLGQEWFGTLDEATQRDMMGEDRFAAWQAGKFSFSRLATHTHDDTWGGSLHPTPLTELVREAKQAA